MRYCLHLKSNRAQVALESALSFIVAMVFLVGIVRVGGWFISSMVKRHQAFESTRIGEEGGPGDVNFYLVTGANRLDIFSEYNGQYDMPNEEDE